MIEFVRKRLQEIEKTFTDKIMKLGTMTKEEQKKLEEEISFGQQQELTNQGSEKEIEIPSEIYVDDVEKAFHGINLVIIPIIRELIYIRKILDFLYKITP